MELSTLKAWSPRQGEWSRAHAAHLLRRAGFGPRPGDVERVHALGLAEAIRFVMRGSRADESAVAAVRHILPTGSHELLRGWWMGLILEHGDPLVERVALMWHDHFATSVAKVRDIRMMHAQNTLFRESGLGDFRKLLRAVAKDPAMLVWLDSNENVRGRPNENLARELFELFGLGIGNYDEGDIREGARALTGRGVRGRAYHMSAHEHDAGTKVVFGKSGAFDGDALVDLVLEHPACARHIARRILNEFVEDAPEEAVGELASVLVSAEWNAGAAIECVLRSELFFHPDNVRARISSPVELIASCTRALGAKVAPSRAAEAAARMGQDLFQPPSVKGWDGGRTWIHAGSWIARHNALLGWLEGDDGTVDLASAFPAERPAEVRDLVLEGMALTPGPELLDALDRAVADAQSVEDARRTVVALVVTAPEFHLI